MKKLVIALLAFALLFSVAPKARADVNATVGFKAMATDTMTVVASQATRVPTMPADTSNLSIYAVSGDINYGYSGVSSTTSNLYIPEGTMKEFDNLAGRIPHIYLIVRTAVATETGTVKFESR